MALNVVHYRPSDPVEAVEYDHFVRMLPALREQHPGDYVAVCGGEVIARGMFFNEVYADGKKRAAGRAVYLGFIDPHDYVVHFGGFTIVEGGE